MIIELVKCVSIGFLIAGGNVNGQNGQLIYIEGTSLAPGNSHVKLNCVTTDEHRNGQVNWRFSKTGITFEKLQEEEDRVRIEGPVLWLQSVTRKDVGVYRCCFANGTCTTKPLFVVLTDTDKKIKCVEDFSCESATFDVRPNERFSLTVHHGSLSAISDIKMPESSKKIGFCAHFNHWHKYKNSTTRLSYELCNATMQDSGVVNVHIAFDRVHLLPYLIHVRIEGKPAVKMNDYHVVMGNGTTGTENLLCKAQAHPNQNFTFHYQPCPTMGLSDSNCHDREWIQIEHPQFTQIDHSTNVQAMVPSWNVSVPGRIQCKATNRLGHDSATSYMYLHNFVEPMQFRLVSPTDGVLYGEDIVITCAVDIYNFTSNVTIRNIVKNSDVHASSTTVLDRYAWKTTYENNVVPTIFTRNTEFICEAIDKQGSVRNGTLQVTIYDPISPHVTEGKPVRYISLGANKTTTLVCNIEGIPLPKFAWSKNGQHHAWRKDYITVMLEEGETEADYVCVGWSKLGKTNITWHIVREKTIDVVLIVYWGTVGIVVIVLLVITIVQVVKNKSLRKRLHSDSHSLCDVDLRRVLETEPTPQDKVLCTTSTCEHGTK